MHMLMSVMSQIREEIASYRSEYELGPGVIGSCEMLPILCYVCEKTDLPILCSIGYLNSLLGENIVSR